jgi:hypothetical protein
MVNKPFVNFAFPATGTSTNRTMPARLAEVKNVLDFGADPTQTTDSRAAVQAAVDWTTTSPNRGTIYFPAGRYLIGSPGINLDYAGNLSVRFIGDGAASAVVGTGTNYYLFDRSLATPSNYDTKISFELMSISNNGSGCGCIRIGSSIGTSIKDCTISAGAVGINTEDAVGVSSRNLHISQCIFKAGIPIGSIAVIGGGGGIIEASDCHGIGTAYRLYGNGWVINGGRTETCDFALELGIDSAGNDVGLNGLVVTGHTYEANFTTIDFKGTVTGFVIGPVQLNTHNLSGSDQSKNGGDYAVRVRANKAKAGVFLCAVTTGGPYSVAALANEDHTNRPLITWLNSQGFTTSGPEWAFGTKAHNAGYDNVGWVTMFALWTFSQLPSGAGNVFEGDEYNITDANTATWGANVTAGGGANRVRVRWNGTNWTVCGV